MKWPKWPQTKWQSYGTKKHSVYVYTTLTKWYGKLQLIKLLCAARNSHNRNIVVVGICHDKCRSCAFFFKRGGNIHCTVTITAVQFFEWLTVQRASITPKFKPHENFWVYGIHTWKHSLRTQTTLETTHYALLPAPYSCTDYVRFRTGFVHTTNSSKILYG